MFTANAKLDTGAGLSSAVRSGLHQLSDAILINGDKGVLVVNALLFISGQEPARIIA